MYIQGKKGGYVKEGEEDIRVGVYIKQLENVKSCRSISYKFIYLKVTLRYSDYNKGGKTE